MGKQSQFAEILESKIRSDLSKDQAPLECSREFDTDPAHLAYLMSQIQRLNFTSKKTTFAYPSLKRPTNTHPRVQEKPSIELPPHVLTETELQAANDFKNWNEALNPRFSKAELKAAFRRLAKRLHPDLSLKSGSPIDGPQTSF